MTLVTDIGTSVTAVGVLAAVVQIRFNQRQARTTFEDSLAATYRQLIAELPVAVMLGKTLDPIDTEAALPTFYRYFDLCNEQVFLRETHRVSASTWAQWREGIATNVGRAAFLAAWRAIESDIPGEFREFRNEFATELHDRGGLDT